MYKVILMNVLIKVGLFTFMNMDFLIVLANLYPSLPIMLKFSSVVGRSVVGVGSLMWVKDTFRYSLNLSPKCCSRFYYAFFIVFYTKHYAGYMCKRLDCNDEYIVESARKFGERYKEHVSSFNPHMATNPPQITLAHWTPTQHSGQR